MTGADQDLARHIPALRRFAWALTRRSDEADDLVQDCLERALLHGRSWRGKGDPRAWLFAILHNLFISARRQAMRRTHVPLEDAPEPSHQAGQDDVIAFGQVLAALQQLPQDQRAVMLLVGVEDLSYEAAARVLGVPVGTVMSRLSRGRERLRQVLAEGDGAAPGSGALS